MVGTQYEAILRDFGEFFKCKLAPDKNNTCIVAIPDSVEVQIELLKGKLLIVSKLGMVQGGFRDTVLREALKANEFYDLSDGAFGLGKRSKEIMLFMSLDIDQLNPDKINTLMPPFIAKAKLWADGILSGNLPPIEEISAAKKAPSPFGLK